MVSKARIAASALAVGAVGAVTATPAMATDGAESRSSPYTRADPQDLPYPGGDITQIKVTNPPGDFDELHLELTTRRPSNPFSSRAWREGNTKIIWNLYVDPGPSVDARIVVTNDGEGTVTPTLYKGGGPFVCPVGGTSYGYLGGVHTVGVTRICVPLSGAVRARAAFQYQPPGRMARIDRAPQNSTTPFVDAAI